LVVLVISDEEEKGFATLKPVVNVKKTFLFVTDD
jgi:hypothetical protein